MTEPTLLEAHEQFATVLDGLRRKQLDALSSWLASALDRDTRGAHAEAPERESIARKRLAQNFIDEAAPPLIRTLSPQSERDILAALRGYEARFEPRPEQASSFPDHQWQASVSRTAIGAAFGAVIGLLLLALGQFGGGAGPLPTARTQVTQEPPAVTQPSVAVVQAPAPAPADRVAQGPNPQAPQGKGPPQAPPAEDPSAVARLWVFSVFAVALGAAVGVVLIAFPPVPVLLRRAGLPAGVLAIVQKFGKTFGGVLLLLRGSTFIALAAVMVSMVVGVLTLMTQQISMNIAQIVLGLLALATILVARWTAPDERTADRQALRRVLLDRFDRSLRADAEVWAALSAGLVLKRGPDRAPDSDASRKLNEVVTIILGRRRQNDAPENILRVVEQNLRLAARTPEPPQAETEFVFQRHHLDAYTTFGAVEIGDRVEVIHEPVFISNSDGTRRVTQKGEVAPARTRG
jgi:hypothetical protein